MTLSITKLCYYAERQNAEGHISYIIMLSIMTFSITTLSIMTFSITTLSIMTFSITIRKNTTHNIMAQCYYAEYSVTI